MVNDEDFIGKEYPQKCGDILVPLEKIKNKSGIYKVKFLKYPCEIITYKSSILGGSVLNPQIEVEEFIKKEWFQNCGDSLKIIKKSEKKDTKNNYLWECEFLKYPCKILALKSNIVRGKIVNPLLNDIIGKKELQHCGDIFEVLEKTKQKSKRNGSFLYKGRFLKYPCEIVVEKETIMNNAVVNPNLPWKCKESLQNFINENFNKKPSLIELSHKLEISLSHISHLIVNYNLQQNINYSNEGSFVENLLRDFISNLLKYKVNNTWNELDGKEIDIYIPNLKLGFEYNGNYWHSNEYIPNNYHQEKSLLARDKGIKLFHIFEYEWNNNEQLIKNFIKSKLGIFECKIYARKCKIKKLQNTEYQDFCNNNHLQGTAGAVIKLGLFYKEELVQIMSFSKPRFTDKYQWEIIRECSKQGYCVLGGKEKLWSYFVKNYNPESVISYCDFSKFDGDSYLKLGFTKERLNKPGFVWWSNKGNCVYWRNPYKHNEYKEKEYSQIYDCGQLVFVWLNIK